MAKKKYYVVWEGVNPGIYDSWAACQQQIKGFPNAKYKAFKSREEAEAAFYGNFADFVGKGKSAGSKQVVDDATREKEIIWDSLSVDAACSGNPGVMEYQGVDTRTKDRIFYQHFKLGTNNIGEFLALVHGLALLHQQGRDIPVYSDSRIAMGWVRQKKCKTKLKRTPQTAELYQLIERAEKWLKTHSFPNQLLKWETERWGEIPADFGRKK